MILNVIIDNELVHLTKLNLLVENLYLKLKLSHSNFNTKTELEKCNLYIDKMKCEMLISKLEKIIETKNSEVQDLLTIYFDELNEDK